MGVTKTADGRVEVGVGISSADNYLHGVNSGEILIQLTESGVTDESLNKLNGLKDYAVYHLSRGESIKPGGTAVFIATADGKKQIEADDFAISVTPGEGDDPDVVEFTVGGIVWNSVDGWDYSNAGQGGGGSAPLILIHGLDINRDQVGDEISIDYSFNDICVMLASGVMPLFAIADVTNETVADRFAWQYVLSFLGAGGSVFTLELKPCDGDNDYAIALSADSADGQLVASWN